MADTTIQEGDKASWKWSGSRPSGEVAEVKEHGDLSIQSNKGNTITKTATEGDPAVHLARSGNDVVKKASELTIDERGNDNKSKTPEPSKKEEKSKANGAEKANGASEPAEKKEEEVTNGDTAETGDKPKADKPAKKEEEEVTNGDTAETGDKRKADEPAVVENGANDDESAKKQKTNGDAEATEKKAKGKPGRPKKAPGEKKAPAKKREPKKAATESGEPRRSGRNRN